MNDPDQSLVDLSKKGDQAAFGKLIAKHYDFVYAVVFGILRNREDALEITQEVFLKVSGEIQKFEGQAKFKTWLYRIAANRAIDEVRKRRPTEPIEEQMDLKTSDISPREAASREELQRLAEKALDALNPEQRAVLVLRHWNELSYEEIAETLDIDIGTVMSRLFYGRKKMAQVLGIKLKDERNG